MKDKEVKTFKQRKNTPIKKRSSSAYDRKVKRVTDWHNRLMDARKKDARENPNTKQPAKRVEELKPLDFYVSKIKRPMGDAK